MAKKTTKKAATEAEKSEQTTAQKWLDKIRAAKEVKKQWRDKFRVDLAYNYRDGVQRPAHIPESEWITINKIYSNLKGELPSLYANDPYFYIKLAKSYSPHPMDIARMELKGEMRQSMLNYLKRELELKPKVRLCILDAYFQYGVIKTHYTADMVENEEAGQPMMDGETMMMDGSGQPVLQPNKIPTNEAYKLSRIHPDDFLVDADAGPLEDDIGWVAQIIRRPLEDVREDERYDKAVRAVVKPTEAREDQVQKERERRKKGAVSGEETVEPNIVVLYELYNLRKKEWLVVTDGADDFLMQPGSLPKGVERHPFNTLRLGLLRDDGWYPIPPVSQWLDPQRENNELRSKILTHRKRFNRKYEVYAEAFADPDSELAKLENGGDGTILRKQQPGQAVFPIADAPLDQNHIQELIMFRGDFEELASGANQLGSGSGVDSATEAGIIEKRLTMREGDNLSLVMDFTTDIGRKVDQLVQANITREQAVRVAGPRGETWELIKPEFYDAIDGEYQYTLNTGATTPQLPEIERAQWMAFLGLLGNAPQLALSKSLLKRSAEMHHIEDENLIEELHQIAKGMMSGQLQSPGSRGSMPGQPDMMTRPASMTGGMAAGINNIRGGAQ